MNQLVETFESLSNFTTLKVGGTAEWLAEPQSLEEIKNLISWAKDKQIKCEIIGAGSNLLINDCLIKGLTICTRKMHGLEINNDSGVIKVYAGEPIPALSRRVARSGLSGFEWAVGIPGTIGGGIVMNAGAQGGCIADRLLSIEAISIKEGKIFKLKNKDLNFSYRNSLLQSEELIVINAEFRLETGHNPKEINAITTKNLNHRVNTQPYQLPSCGSVFRNPEPYKAAKLIEDLGLKGLNVGGAEVSTTHANFIVNTGDASASDIQSLIKIIQKKVKENYGLVLHPEVKEVGFKKKDYPGI